MTLRKHVNNTDVAIEIVKRFYVREKALWKLKVRWWNIGTKHEPWDMRLEQRLDVPREAMGDWVIYEKGATTP